MIALLTLALAEPLSPQAQLVLDSSVRSTELDLWRAWPGADKVLVMVGLPDGSQELFMLDTGAATSVIHTEIADRLGITSSAKVDGYIQGLSGQVPWVRGVLPELKLGGFTLRGVDIAIGLPGLPDSIGALPLAGILGTNVWSNFVVTVDYPSDTLRLAVSGPGDGRAPKRAPKLDWSESSARTTLTLRTEAIVDGKPVSTESEVELDVDTGAAGLLLVGPRGEPFRGYSTVGEEPVAGLGADLDKLPDTKLLSPTRRVPISRVKIGGQVLDVPVSAR